MEHKKLERLVKKYMDAKDSGKEADAEKALDDMIQGGVTAEDMVPFVVKLQTELDDLKKEVGELKREVEHHRIFHSTF